MLEPFDAHPVYGTDMTLLLIYKKAGFGLAPGKWRTTLAQIRDLPEAQAAV